MKIKAMVFSVGLILASFTLNVHAEPASRASIVQLIEVTGQLKSSDMIIPPLTQMVVHRIKAQYPNIPAKALLIINQELERGFKGKLNILIMEKMVPVFAKYYSESDVQQLIQFYQTPIGQKLIAVGPLMTMDLLKISQQAAAEVTPEIMQRIFQRLKEEGYIKQQNQKS